jgi:nicotinate-nucleotide adenylyltransferase
MYFHLINSAAAISGTTSAPIGILGGTFDPIHFGHIQLAQSILKKLNLSVIRFIPNYQPPHRNTPLASPKHRLAMVKIALEDYPRLITDQREIERQGISYTIDTLKSLRSEFPNIPLCWIVGFDEFAKLNTWHDFQALNQYAHLIIVNRPNTTHELPEEVNSLLLQNETQDPDELSTQPAGKIYQLQISPCEISATELREQLKQGQKPKKMLPKKVYDYIKQNKLYES